MLPAACLAAQRSRVAIVALHGLQLFWDVVRTVRKFRSTTTKVPSDRAGKRGRGQSWTPRWRGRDDVAEMRILPPPPRSLRSAGSHRWRATPPRSVGGESAASRDGHRWPGRRPSCCAGPFNAGIAGTGFTACGRHHQHLAIGGEFQHRLAVLGTQQGKLHGREPHVGGKPQRHQSMDVSGWFGCNWAGRDAHQSRPLMYFRVGRIGEWLPPGAPLQSGKKSWICQTAKRSGCLGELLVCGDQTGAIFERQSQVAGVIHTQRKGHGLIKRCSSKVAGAGGSERQLQYIRQEGAAFIGTEQLALHLFQHH